VVKYHRFSLSLYCWSLAAWSRLIDDRGDSSRQNYFSRQINHLSEQPIYLATSHPSSQACSRSRLRRSVRHCRYARQNRL